MTATRQPPRTSAEREVKAVMRRFRKWEADGRVIVAERDRVIREAVAAGLSGERLKELTGLSQPRISQLGRGIKR